MFGMMNEFAARRGDGLRPELLELLHRPPQNVIDLSEFRPAARRQAGPNAVARLPDVLPDNVVLFRAPAPGVKPVGERPLTPRIGRAKRLTRRRD